MFSFEVQNLKEYSTNYGNILRSIRTHRPAAEDSARRVRMSLDATASALAESVNVT